MGAGVVRSRVPTWREIERLRAARHRDDNTWQAESALVHQKARDCVGLLLDWAREFARVRSDANEAGSAVSQAGLHVRPEAESAQREQHLPCEEVPCEGGCIERSIDQSAI